MALANNAPVNARGVLDANFVVTVALPNAANSVNTNALDLVQATPWPTINYVVAQVIVGAGNGANNKNINAVLQHSADTNTSNFTNITYLAAPLFSAQDNNGGGVNATTANVQLPPGTKRYIRAQATGEANGGNSANANLTLQLL
jgi:hypothetical protein